MRRERGGEVGQARERAVPRAQGPRPRGKAGVLPPPSLTHGLTFPPGSPSLLGGQPLCPSIPRGESQTRRTQLGTGEPPAASSWAPVARRGAGLGPQHIVSLPESAEPRTGFGYFLHVPLPFEGLGLLHLSPHVGAVKGSRPGSWPHRLP